MKKLILLGLAAALSISAMGATKKKAAPKKALSPKTLELNVIHINDHHSHLEEEKMELVLNGKKVTLNVGGMPRMIQRISDLKKANKNNLVLHAGDALSGTLY